ncbi:thymidylate synthase [Patescibacteria group bacterium]|nr:thymidylate synthase [Patescibacteria group bacterium]
MQTYNDVLDRIMREGIDRVGRNATTRALFAIQMRFKMSDGFPAVTTKKLAFKAMKAELLWFLEGSGDDNRLKEITGTEKTIWTDNARADYWKPKAKFDGDLGRIYGVQWRSWQGPGGKKVDQIKEAVDKIKNNPADRRIIVTAWNPGEIDQMALPPCHMLFQFFVADGKLSLHMIQRSCDMFLGVPFNIASYSLLLHMMAQVTGTVAEECIITFNDAHIYHEHFDAVKEQLSRKPMPLPQLWLNQEVKDIDTFKMDDIRLEYYQSYPAIPAKMIV